MIIADDREPDYIIGLLRRWGAQIEIRRINVGDYVIGKLGIERKNIHDLYRSIIDKRLFDQVNRLRDAYEESLLILEGDIDRFRERIPNPNVILGGILTVVVDIGIKILYSRDMDETAKILHMIWKRRIKRREATVMRYKPKILSKRDRLIYILEGFPGIGGRLAENILNRYRTIRNFANTSISELSTIEGIGEKKAREIYELLNFDFKKSEE